MVLGSARDITERKRMEVALRVSEAGLRAAQRLAHIGSADWDLVAQTHAISDELFRIYGLDSDEYWREPGIEKFLDRIHEEDRPWVRRVFEAAKLEGQDYDIQYRLVHPDGNVRWVQSIGSVGVDADGKPIRIEAILQDITDRRAMEAQLVQSQKMEAVGRLAGGIAHDFNNLLTVVNGHSELAMDAIDEGDPLYEDLRQISRAGHRAAALTGKLLAFSRQQMLQPRVLDLNTVVAEFEELLRRTIGEDIEILTVLDPALARIKADPGQIEQILLNLTAP